MTTGLTYPTAKLQAFLLALSALMLAETAGATASDDVDLLDKSLEELMNISVDTAGNFSSSWRSQPGIITVFNTSDITAMGARTLRDVLLHIPGVSLGMDTQNAVNLVVRGNWAFEGKIQYQVNDIPVNDLLYGTFPLPPYFPAEQLDRIEILRGPGSVKYGNSAQLAVIRIYTKTAQSDAKVSITGLSQSGVSTKMLSVNKGIRLESGAVSISGSANQGHWGSGVWVDHIGNRASLDSIATDGASLAISADLDATHLEFFHSRYDMDNIQQYGTYAPTAQISFRDTNLALSHNFTLADTWTLRPHFGFRDEADWRSSSSFPDYVYDYDVRARRIDGSLEATKYYSAESSATFGIFQQRETARAISVDMPPENYFPPDGELSYKASAVYGNWDLKLGRFDLSLGARASNHDYSGSAFSPRLGITRTEEHWHFKWLRGSAFREPDIQTSNPAFHSGTEKLKAENTTINEVEFGHTLGRRSYLTLSLFDQTIEDPIIYSYAPGYSNNPAIKARGLDLQYWYKANSFDLQANYSHANANDNDLAIYDVAGHRGQNVGAAKDIANLWFTWKTPVAGLNLHVDMRYLGARYAQVYSSVNMASSQQELEAEKTLNLAISYKFNSVDWNLGVRNISNQQQFIPQAYNDVSTAFPFDNRELWLRAEFSL
jgi:outer membrane cobalamin receptor